MNEENTPENQASPSIAPPTKDPARKAELAADAKAEEVRALVQSKGEQGKSGLGFLAVDSEDNQ
jgi:hypothetical protein